MPEVTLMEQDLGHVLYAARMRSAWGDNWKLRSQWPSSMAAWRAYPHNPVAEVDLILEQARAALSWMHAVFGVDPVIKVRPPVIPSAGGSQNASS